MVNNRKAQLEEFNRKHILRAALYEFSRRGYQKTTMDRIAKRAGYSAAALYRYYDSKRVLFTAVLSLIRDETLAALLEPLPPQLPFEARLRARISRLFTFAEENQGHFAALLAQRGLMEWDLGNYPQRVVREFYQRYRGVFTDLMKLGVKENVLLFKDPEFYATAIIGLVDAFGYQWIQTPSRYPLRELVDRVVETFMRGASQP